MKKGRVYTLDYRRKRKGKTNYRTRLKLLASGKSRVIVRRMLNNIGMQLVNFESKGDKILVSCNSRELLKYGWKGHRGNISSAYLIGLLCGFKAKKKGINTGVADFGIYRSVQGSGLFAALKGLLDAGFSINVGKEVLPADNRISGKHIESYAAHLKGKPEYEKQFSQYLKSGLKPEEFSKHFEEVKKKIIEKWRG